MTGRTAGRRARAPKVRVRVAESDTAQRCQPLVLDVHLSDSPPALSPVHNARLWSAAFPTSPTRCSLSSPASPLSADSSPPSPGAATPRHCTTSPSSASSSSSSSSSSLRHRFVRLSPYPSRRSARLAALGAMPPSSVKGAAAGKAAPRRVQASPPSAKPAAARRPPAAAPRLSPQSHAHTHSGAWQHPQPHSHAPQRIRSMPDVLSVLLSQTSASTNGLRARLRCRRPSTRQAGGAPIIGGRDRRIDGPTPLAPQVRPTTRVPWLLRRTAVLCLSVWMCVSVWMRGSFLTHF